MTPDETEPKPKESIPAPAKESNIGNPSRAGQVIAGDKPTAPDVLPPKETSKK